MAATDKVVAARLLKRNHLDRFSIQKVDRKGSELAVLYTTSTGAFSAKLEAGVLVWLDVVDVAKDIRPNN